MVLHSTFIYTSIHTKHFIISGISQPPPVCSFQLDDDTVQWCQCAHHTPDTGGEERVMLSIQGWGLLGGNDWQGPIEGICPGHQGYICLICRMVIVQPNLSKRSLQGEPSLLLNS